MTRVDWGTVPVRYDTERRLYWVHRHGINWYVSPCCHAVCSADHRGVYCKACYQLAPEICGTGPHHIEPTREQLEADNYEAYRIAGLA